MCCAGIMCSRHLRSRSTGSAMPAPVTCSTFFWAVMPPVAKVAANPVGPRMATTPEFSSPFTLVTAMSGLDESSSNTN